jgi:hypothetical protein
MEDQPEAAAQTWQTNAFLALNATGQLAEISIVPAAVTAVYSMVYNPASTIADNNTRTEPVSVDGEILISISNSIDEALAITSQALVGDKFALRRVVTGTTQFWTVDIANAANQHVQIQKLHPGDAVGTQHGRVYAKVLKSLLQYQP